MTITPEQLAEWERLAGEATPAERWAPYVTSDYHAGTFVDIGVDYQTGYNPDGYDPQASDDAAFIAAARSAVPLLCQRVRALEQELQEARDDCWMMGCGPETVTK